MFESDVEDNVFRRRLMKEVAPGVPVHFSFYSPSVKVQVMYPAEHMQGANGRYVGDAVTIEFVPEDAAAVERVREYVWYWENHNAFTAVRKINHLRRGVCPESVQGILELVRGVDKRAASKVAGAVDAEELRELVDEVDTKALGRLPGMGEKRARAVRARRLGDPDPLGPDEPPGHTTVRSANLLHPLPTTPSLMSRGVYYPEQIEHFADTLGRVLVDGERLAGVDALRIQRGKLFHTTKLPGVGMKTRARVLASGLLDAEYTYANLLTIPGLTEAQASTIAEAARAARTEIRVS